MRVVNMDKDQFEALKAVSDAILNCIVPEGAPSGTIYAVLTGYGCTLEQYEGILAGLDKAGLIYRKGDLLYPVKKVVTE